MHAAPEGTPRTDWRETYDRGTRTKPGQINQGTGATPALLGNSYIGSTDNADPRMHVLVYRRRSHVNGDRLVCSVPVFRPGASATENSLTAWGNGFTVENDYGYTSTKSTQGGMSTPGGITKIEVDKGATAATSAGPARNSRPQSSPSSPAPTACCTPTPSRTAAREPTPGTSPPSTGAPARRASGP